MLGAKDRGTISAVTWLLERLSGARAASGPAFLKDLAIHDAMRRTTTTSSIDESCHQL